MCTFPDEWDMDTWATDHPGVKCDIDAMLVASDGLCRIMSVVRRVDDQAKETKTPGRLVLRMLQHDARKWETVWFGPLPRGYWL
jgi:hypothetical protein